MDEDSLKLTAYLGERDRVGDRFLADAVIDIFARAGTHISILLRGVEGFGARHGQRTDRLLTLSEDLSVVAVAVDTRERIERVLPEIRALDPRPMMTLEPARLLGPGLDAPQLPQAAKLTIYLGRRRRVGGSPAYRAICDVLHRGGLYGATVLLGVDGTVAGERRRAGFLARNADVPLMVLAVGSAERIAPVLPELRALLPEALVTLEPVQLCKRDGVLVGAPPELPAADEEGLPRWQELVVYSSEASRHGGLPVHRALVRGLRSANAAGATSIRGLWGFHGERPPHGDRLLQLRRHAPVVTVAVDTPDRIASAFAVVDEVTAEHGLVTAAVVPALMPRALPPA